MLLTHILGPVKAGIFSGLRGMLEIMEKYGNETTKQLAVEMNERLNKEDDYAEKHVSFVYLTYYGSPKYVVVLYGTSFCITLLKNID